MSPLRANPNTQIILRSELRSVSFPSQPARLRANTSRAESAKIGVLKALPSETRRRKAHRRISFFTVPLLLPVRLGAHRSCSVMVFLREAVASRGLRVNLLACLRSAMLTILPSSLGLRLGNISYLSNILGTTERHCLTGRFFKALRRRWSWLRQVSVRQR